MRFTIIVCAVILGSSCLSNVDGTLHKLFGGLLGGGLLPLQPGSQRIPGFGLFDEFTKILHRIFGNDDNGINVFLDGSIRGMPNIFNNLFGVDKIEKFLGPLSKIPDDANIPNLLGGKFEGKEHTLGLLIQIAKKFCLSGKCEKMEFESANGKDQKTFSIGGEDKDYKKFLENFFGSYNHQIESGLSKFNSEFEKLMSSLGNGKHNEIFKILSKLPDDFDPNHILGRGDSSGIIDGILSRRDMLDILRKFSKSKCSSGCDKS